MRRDFAKSQERNRKKEAVHYYRKYNLENIKKSKKAHYVEIKNVKSKIMEANKDINEIEYEKKLIPAKKPLKR